MTPILLVTLSFIWGALLGLLFFGGLWFTVKALPHSKRPNMLWVLSFLLRLAVLVAGFIALTGFGAQACLAAVAGVIATRLLLSRRLGPKVALKHRRSNA